MHWPTLFLACIYKLDGPVSYRFCISLACKEEALGWVEALATMIPKQTPPPENGSKITEKDDPAGAQPKPTPIPQIVEKKVDETKEGSVRKVSADLLDGLSREIFEVRKDAAPSAPDDTLVTRKLSLLEARAFETNGYMNLQEIDSICDLHIEGKPPHSHDCANTPPHSHHHPSIGNKPPHSPKPPRAKPRASPSKRPDESLKSLSSGEACCMQFLRAALAGWNYYSCLRA
jgi:hypothetical protein